MMSVLHYTPVLCTLVLLVPHASSAEWVDPLLGNAQSDGTMDLVILSNPSNPDAMCLDGTSPGYYTRRNSASNNWVIFIQGGGWCYNAEDCLARSKTRLGSNKFWGNTTSGQGIMSANPEVNPDFADWNVAYFQYCDGASFAGYNTTVQQVQGTSLYYRGFAIMESLMVNITDEMGPSVENVVVGGCSAGGLATYLHADYITNAVHTRASTQARVKAMPVSGFFMDEATMQGQNLYPFEMAWVFENQNMTSGVNQGCIQANIGSESKCVFAQNNYPYIKTPLFIVNSLYDSWQAGNIWKPPGSCAGNETACTPKEIEYANKYRSDMLHAITAAAPFNSPQSGAYMHSCWSHCLGRSNQGWDKVIIPGAAYNMRTTFAKWFFTNATNTVSLPSTLRGQHHTKLHVRTVARRQNQDTASTSPFNLIGCELSTTSPYRCNPTCP